MKIDGLNKRIVIQKRTTTKVKGIPTDQWDAFYTCWCSINSLFGNELYKSLEIQLENVLNFTVRYTKDLEALNTKEYRVVWGKKTVDEVTIVDGIKKVNKVEKDRTFNIVATDYFSFNKEKITIKAKEVI